tara:strand:+ start:165 stop:434 length:270 start_codon:yes stop_codon:yes gene_type:complete
MPKYYVLEWREVCTKWSFNADSDADAVSIFNNQEYRPYVNVKNKSANNHIKYKLEVENEICGLIETRLEDRNYNILSIWNEDGVIKDGI